MAMQSKTKQMQLLLTADDEAQFVASIRTAIPLLRIVADSIWPTSAPPLVEDLAASDVRHVYLWDPEVSPSLLCRPTTDGRWRGPTSGVVIHWERCELSGSSLLAGSIGVGFSDPKMARFVAVVWKVAMALTTNDIALLDGSRLPHRAGADAFRWVSADPGRVFAARNSPVLFLPRELLSRF